MLEHVWIRCWGQGVINMFRYCICMETVRRKSGARPAVTKFNLPGARSTRRRPNPILLLHCTLLPAILRYRIELSKLYSLSLVILAAAAIALISVRVPALLLSTTEGPRGAMPTNVVSSKGPSSPVRIVEGIQHTRFQKTAIGLGCKCCSF